MNKLEKWIDSYYHYRTKVDLGRFASFKRACYYEIKHKEPDWTYLTADESKNFTD